MGADLGARLISGPATLVTSIHGSSAGQRRRGFQINACSIPSMFRRHARRCADREPRFVDALALATPSSLFRDPCALRVAAALPAASVWPDGIGLYPPPPEVPTVDKVTPVVCRRGRLTSHERFDAARTALVVFDMQNYFVAECFPGEVPLSRNCHQSVSERRRDQLAAPACLKRWVPARRCAPSGDDHDGFSQCSPLAAARGTPDAIR
jgi:hypothetical protein